MRMSVYVVDFNELFIYNMPRTNQQPPNEQTTTKTTRK